VVDEGPERSEAGDPIYRHKEKERGWTPPDESCVHLEEIEAHLSEHVGEVETVFHELVSDLVHLDVLFLRATAERPYHLLVTSGASDRPMAVPEGMEEFRLAEFMIALPPDWPLDEDSLEDENNYWPVRMLKITGRFAHEYETWLGWGHTMQLAEPEDPIADTGFTGVIVLPPYELPPEFFRMETKAGELIHFYNLVPLYPQEMDLKLKKGAEELEKLFEVKEIGMVLDKSRPNVAGRTGWLR
jgi:hypothetical protein